MSEWIKVEDRLPLIGEWANLLTDARENGWTEHFAKMRGESMLKVVCGSLRDIDSEGYAEWEQCRMPDGGPFRTINYVTHWMPLPAAPEEACETST